MLRRHHNRPLASYRADFLPCRGNREIERKERGREREKEGKEGGETSRNLRGRIPMWNQAKREILNESECLREEGEIDRPAGSEKFEGRERSRRERKSEGRKGVPFLSMDAMSRIVDDPG